MADWHQDIQDACDMIGGVAIYLDRKCVAFSQVGNDVIASELATKAQLLTDVKNKIKRALSTQLDKTLRETRQLHDAIVMPIVKGEIKVTKGESQ